MLLQQTHARQNGGYSSAAGVSATAASYAAEASTATTRAILVWPARAHWRQKCKQFGSHLDACIVSADIRQLMLLNGTTNACATREGASKCHLKTAFKAWFCGGVCSMNTPCNPAIYPSSAHGPAGESCTNPLPRTILLYHDEALTQGAKAHKTPGDAYNCGGVTSTWQLMAQQPCCTTSYKLLNNLGAAQQPALRSCQCISMQRARACIRTQNLTSTAGTFVLASTMRLGTFVL